MNFERKSARRAALLSGAGVLLCFGAGSLIGCEEQGVEDTTLPPPDTTVEPAPGMETTPDDVEIVDPPATTTPETLPPPREPAGSGLDEPLPQDPPPAEPETDPESPVGG